MDLDARLSRLTLVAALLLLWPLLAYGRPAYFQDSAAYYKGGQAAVTFALEQLHVSNIGPRTASPSGAAAGTPQPTAQGTQPPVVRGSRSVAYSVAAYVLGAPEGRMWLLVVGHALAAGFLVGVTLLLFAGETRPLWWKMVALAVATPVAFVTCIAVPDIFAGLVVLAIVLLATAYERLSPGVRIVTALIAAGGIAFHASHLPLGLAVTLVALAWMAIGTLRTARPARANWLWVAAPFLLGATATMTLNLVAFGGPSLTGKRYPLTLARSISEGPGKWYLDKNCRHLKYAVCEIYPNGVPGTIDSFLWGKDGVKERATPEQLDRIRDEESAVVLAAARAYPFEEFRRLGVNFAQQLIRFKPGVGLESRVELDAANVPVLRPAAYDPTWVTLVHRLTIASVIAGLGLLALRFRAVPSLRPMIGLVIAGLIINAAVCVYFSGVANRYQARVIWLVPLLALAALGQNGRSGAASRAASRS